jgi:hypothetical protein
MIFFFIRSEVTNENNALAHPAMPATSKTNNQSQYRFILPRSPLQQIGLNQEFQ